MHDKVGGGSWLGITAFQTNITYKLAQNPMIKTGLKFFLINNIMFEPLNVCVDIGRVSHNYKT